MIEAHRSAAAMARCLMSYIDCDERVRKEVYTSFGTTFDTRTVAEMRRAKAIEEARFRRGPLASSTDTAGWDWRGDRHETNMAIASTALLEAILRERGA